MFGVGGHSSRVESFRTGSSDRINEMKGSSDWRARKALREKKQ